MTREQLKQVVTNRVSQFFTVDSYKVEGKQVVVVEPLNLELLNWSGATWRGQVDRFERSAAIGRGRLSDCRQQSTLTFEPAHWRGKLRAADLVRYDTDGKQVRYWLKHKRDTSKLLKALETIVHSSIKLT